MSVNMIIELDNAYVMPGSQLTGNVIIDGSGAAKINRAFLRLAWHTEGRGDRDQFTVTEYELCGKCELNQFPVRYPFQFTLPRDPWSYTGHYVTIVWELYGELDIPWATNVRVHQAFVMHGSNHQRVGQLLPPVYQEPAIPKWDGYGAHPSKPVDPATVLPPPIDIAAPNIPQSTPIIDEVTDQGLPEPVTPQNIPLQSSVPQDRWDVIIVDAGYDPGHLPIELRKIFTRFTLQDAMTMIESIPTTVASGIPLMEANELELKLRNAGADVKIQPSGQ